MAELHIANTTQQYHSFLYTIPETPAGRYFTQEIAPGGQIKIAARGGNLSPDDIEAIISHHRPYGLVMQEEVGRARGLVPLIARIGKSVDLGKIQQQYIKNQEVLADRGREQRAAAAVALDRKIEENMLLNDIPGTLRSTVFDVEEIHGARVLDATSRRQGMEQVLAGTPSIGEGINVSREGAEATSRRPSRRTPLRRRN